MPVDAGRRTMTAAPDSLSDWRSADRSTGLESAFSQDVCMTEASGWTL
jgi:hypothetical protein